MDRCQPIFITVYQIIFLATLIIVCVVFDNDHVKKSIFFLIFIGLESTITFAVFALDKRRAENKEWRIPEFTLHLLTAFFGILGAVSAMCLCHHKNSKPEFYRITIALAILNLGLYAGLGYLIYGVLN